MSQISFDHLFYQAKFSGITKQSFLTLNENVFVCVALVVIANSLPNCLFSASSSLKSSAKSDNTDDLLMLFCNQIMKYLLIYGGINK